MISEVNFARGYTSFWTEYTPWINDFVLSINKGLLARIQSPIEIGDDTIHRSINNVIAFTLFKNVITKDNSDLNEAYIEARKIIKQYPRSNLKSYEPTNDYVRIINKLSERLVNRYKSKSIKFSPQFNGCGIMESCQGDVYYDKTLVEIKAGGRGILSSDIKQIITYCALNWLSRESMVIDNVELYNPRQGILWQSNLNELIMLISNLPTEDLFDQIGKYLSGLSEDIEF